MSKEIKFEKGKWYKADFGFTRYFKVSHFDEVNVYSDEHFDDNNEYRLFIKEWKTRTKWLVEKCTEVDILEIQDYLPINHPDRIVGLPEEYIVECDHETEFVKKTLLHYYNYKCSDRTWSWKYVVCAKELFKNNSSGCPKGDAITDTIQTNFKHLPVFTYEQWLKLKDMNKEFKVPGRWCVKLDENNINTFRKYNNTDWCESKGFIHSSKVGYNEWNETIVKGYTEITFEQFCKYILNNNTKTMERKIKGYKCPTDLFKGRVKKGSIFSLYSPDKFVMYTPKHTTSGVPTEIVEQWEVVYEDEFKVGDYVLLAGTSTGSGNGISVETAIVKLLPLGSLLGRSGNIDPDFEFVWNGRNLGTCKNHIIRLATPEEIKSVQTKTIVVGDKRITVTIHKGKIVTESQTLNIELFTDLLDVMNGENCLAIANWDVTFPTVKIGCTTLPKSDIELIINTYNSLNE